MRNPPQPGRFKIVNQRASFNGAGVVDPWTGTQRRVRAILESIQRDLFDGGYARVRQILTTPRELFRVEVERDDMSYLRTTILDRDALEALIEETPEQLVEERFSFS